MSPQKSQGTLLRSHQLQSAQTSGPKALPQGSVCSPVRYGSPFAMIGTGRAMSRSLWILFPRRKG